MSRSHNDETKANQLQNGYSNPSKNTSEHSIITSKEPYRARHTAEY